MFLLITTPRFVIGHDTVSKKTEILESGRGNYYGMTWSPTGSDLTLSHSVVDEATLMDLTTYANSELGFLTISGQPTWPFLSAPHQILWVNDTIVVTNTGRNALAKVNPSDQSIIQRRYDAALWDRLTPTGNDGAHFNSLFYKDGTLYVAAHNFTKGSYILELDWPSLEEKRRRPVHNGTGVHNVWIEESGRIITCDSNNGTLIDANSGEVLWSDVPQGYTRGLAATDEIVLVGHSETSGRDVRNATETGVWILDRRDFRTLDYQFIGHFGAVQDVRIADVPDLCHHGKPLSMHVLDGLRTRMRQLGETRLDEVRVREAFAGAWNIALGRPRLPGDQLLGAHPDDLLLCISKEPGTGIAGKLRWRADATGTSHASLVARYEGPDDHNMTAALFEGAGNGELHASLWINQGEWKMLARRTLPNTAIKNGYGALTEIDVDFEAIGPSLVLKLWGESFLTASQGDTLKEGRVGVRLLGPAFEFHDVQCRTTFCPSG